MSKSQMSQDYKLWSGESEMVSKSHFGDTELVEGVELGVGAPVAIAAVVVVVVVATTGARLNYGRSPVQVLPMGQQPGCPEISLVTQMLLQREVSGNSTSLL